MDPDSVSARRLAAVAARVAPGARVAAIGGFAGGLSAQMTVLELAGGRRLVVRQLRDSGSERRSLSLGDEFGLLLHLHERGLAVPPPLLYDDSGRIFDAPYAVFDYVDGAPRVETSDPLGTGRAIADQLAAVHRVELAAAGLPGAVLPRRTDLIGHRLADRPAETDEAMREGFLRDLLAARWPPPEPDRTVLLHGDFWAGNLLWRDDRIVAVIDWEEAATGDPLTDLATTRLDVLWAFGPLAMTAFTDHYLSLTQLPDATLALWDLAAALRPAGAFSAWLADWIDFGRLDMTASLMRERHGWFRDQALLALELSG
ncbi:MAG TPA: phosphotransferase [Acidimicrobiales bacterium]|jgi:aminoglycoside phosphotransferase (APT) family kinase protein